MAEQTASEGEKGTKKEKPPKAPLNTTNLLLLVVLGVLVLLIVGGAIGAIMIFRGGGHASASQTAEAAAEAGGEKTDAPKGGDKKPKEVKEAKKEKEAGPKPPPIYVQLEPPFVVNFMAGKPAKFLQVTMEVMTRDQTTAQIMKDNNPLVRNDLLMLFGGQEYEAVASSEGREALRGRALEAVRGVVKKEGGKPAEVEAVYFTSLVMQ